MPEEHGFLGLIRTTDEKDPGEIFRQVASLECVHMHGPEHHSIVPCIMIAAFRNNGGGAGFEAALEAAAERGTQDSENGGEAGFEAALEAAAERGGQDSENGGEAGFEAALEAAAERGGQVPGGVCGSWGTCGAAIGAGIYGSIIADLTPYTDEGWGAVQLLTARSLEKMAAVGGPRCCKRTSRMAIEACVDFTRERYGVEMPLKDYRCTHYAINEECIHGRCPYF